VTTGVEQAGFIHRRHSKIVALREDKSAKKVV